MRPQPQLYFVTKGYNTGLKQAWFTMQETEEGLIAPVVVRPGDAICTALAKILARSNRIQQHTKLWYTTRSRMITCSDIASVVGLNPYNSRNQVFRKKTGQSKPFCGNHATRRGTALEPVALRAYELKMKTKAWPHDLGLMQHSQYATIGGSPDGVTLDGTLIEIKCPLTRKIVPGVIPGYYVPQVQVLLEIFDLETAHFVQYKPATAGRAEIVDVTVVQRDRELFASWLPLLLDFMQEVFDFYSRVNLPIGTPMIDWESDDPAASQKAARDREIGIGKVCSFVDSMFVVEEYTGPGNPVIRTEHLLTDSPKTSGDVSQLVQDVQEELAQAADAEDDLAPIVDDLPADLCGEAEAEESCDSDEDSGGFIDFDAIRARMQMDTSS